MNAPVNAPFLILETGQPHALLRRHGRLTAGRLARELGPGHTIVTILADYGTRYQSKLFNPEFLRSKNLPIPEWMDATPQIPVPFEAVT